jgi:hypothetical protein
MLLHDVARRAEVAVPALRTYRKPPAKSNAATARGLRPSASPVRSRSRYFQPEVQAAFGFGELFKQATR